MHLENNIKLFLERKKVSINPKTIAVLSVLYESHSTDSPRKNKYQLFKAVQERLPSISNKEFSLALDDICNNQAIHFDFEGRTWWFSLGKYVFALIALLSD